MISRNLPYQPERPFAVPLTTRVDRLRRDVKTEVGVVSLTDADVVQFVTAGQAACNATELLIGGRLHSLETNHAYTVPKTYLDQLRPAYREAIASLLGDD